MLSLYRVLKFSLQDIFRNFWLSVATVTILCLALFSINTLLTARLAGSNAITAVKEKINISLYLKAEAPESQIMDLKGKIAGLPHVKDVSYISKQDALAVFREKYKNNQAVLGALQELGKNPLSPSLVVSPDDFEQSKTVIAGLQGIDSDIIESRDFSDHSLVLNKISDITNRINEVGLFIIGIFILVSLLVVYNTIRVAIYTHRQEIEIMRLVGASNYFVYFPYIFSAFFYALVSLFITILVFYPFLTLIQPYLDGFFAGYEVNILAHFVNNFWPIFGAQFLAVLLINSLASWLAVRRYAKV